MNCWAKSRHYQSSDELRCFRHFSCRPGRKEYCATASAPATTSACTWTTSLWVRGITGAAAEIALASEILDTGADPRYIPSHSQHSFGTGGAADGARPELMGVLDVESERITLFYRRSSKDALAAGVPDREFG